MMAEMVEGVTATREGPPHVDWISVATLQRDARADAVAFCIAHIAVFIEQAWGVYIPDTELTVENMDTLDLIAARVLQG